MGAFFGYFKYFNRFYSVLNVVICDSTVCQKNASLCSACYVSQYTLYCPIDGGPFHVVTTLKMQEMVLMVAKTC